MSSRFQGKCVLNSTAKSKEERRNIHSLLRLDSTGEVTSDCYVNCQHSNMCFGNLNCANCERNRTGVKQKMAGFNVNSMIGKASTYFGTASSYISGFCPYKTAKGLVRNNSFTNDNNIDANKICDNTIPKMAIGNRCGQPQSDMPNSTKTESSIKGFPSACQVLGVLQSSIVKSNGTPVGNMTKTEPYRPPHYMKGKLMQEPIGGPVSKVNPKLTPYNARLLENSRKAPQQLNTETKTACSHPYLKSTTTCHRKISGEINQNTAKVENMLKDQHSINVESEKSAKSDKQVSAEEDSDIGKSVDCDIEAVRMVDIDNNSVPVQPTIVPVNSSENMESKIENDRQPCPDIPDTMPEVTDWFEYESTAIETIPIKLPLQHNNNDNLSTELEQPQGKASSLLHSWLSMELDVDVKKADKQQFGHDSSQNKVEEQCKCNKKLDMDSKPEIPASAHVDEKVDNGKSETESTVAPSAEDLVSVLYIRNCQFSKKGRPSSKKRRRQKAQQNEVPESLDCKNKKNEEQNTSDTKKNNSISFILGLNAENGGESGPSHSFLMTCDMDSDIDWSDDSDLETDCSPECDSNGATPSDFDQFQDCLGLVNFQVTCIQSPEKISESNNELDAVNVAWNIHIRQVEHSTTQKKATSSKKVRFAEEENLAEVHSEIEWCDEYQAARKGPWEEYARDRERFRRRVADTEPELKQIFSQQHRDRVFQERFNTAE